MRLPPNTALCRRLPVLLLAAAIGCLPPLPAAARGASSEEFNLDRRRPPEESLLNLIFGSPPPMATQRGILLIDAFLDGNGNRRRDAGEEDIAGEVSCSLDGIDYTVPAFIPGLRYEGAYQLSCTSAGLTLHLDAPEIFVGRRGEIIRVDIPCTEGPALPSPDAAERPAADQPTATSAQPSTRGK